MAKGYRGESCSNVVRSVMKPGEILSSTDLFRRVHELGAWSDDTIWQHLIAHIVNLPAARHHYADFDPFLFLHEDGRYELYDPTLHPPMRREQIDFDFVTKKTGPEQSELGLDFPLRKERSRNKAAEGEGGDVEPEPALAVEDEGDDGEKKVRS